MSKIQYADKEGIVTGLTTKFDAQDATEIKNSVNALYDHDAGEPNTRIETYDHGNGRQNSVKITHLGPVNSVIVTIQK